MLWDKYHGSGLCITVNLLSAPNLCGCVFMFRIVVGHSNDPDSDAAIEDVLAQCERQLEGLEPQAGILLAAVDFEYELLLEMIDRKYSGLELIGGTTDGEISSVMGFEQDSIALMLFSADGVTIYSGIGEDVSQDEAAAADTAIAMALGDRQLDEIKFAIALPESLTASAVVVLKALEQSLQGRVPVFGGLTADQWRFKRTHQFHNADVYTDALPVLLFSGAIDFGYGVASGWQPIGKTGTVTKVSNNIVYEIDNRPAIEFYQNYLGDRPPSLEYPLAVYEDNETPFYLRATSGSDSVDDGFITFFGDIPEGAIVQLTEASRDEILSASERSMKKAIERFPSTSVPQGALYFSCCARRQILGSHTGEEYKVAQACQRQIIPGIGFYTNGEISPLFETKERACFHNETFVTLLFGEAKTGETETGEAKTGEAKTGETETGETETPE
jgi:hypothetical protein